jgi:hypothetical protein
MKRARKKISLDVDTLQRVLDECYYETNDLKHEITNLYTIWNAKVGDINEIAVVGKDVVKLLDQRDKLIDKKLRVAQQIHTIISDKTKEDNKLKIAEINKKDNSSLDLSNAELPNELDFKINEMIEAAKKRNNN